MNPIRSQRYVCLNFTIQIGGTDIILGFGHLKFSSVSPSNQILHFGLAIENLYLVIDKYENEREKSSMRLIHEPDFKSSYDFSLTSPARSDGRRGSIGSKRPSVADRMKNKDILNVHIDGKVDPMFVDLVKISEEPEFFASDTKDRIACILAAKSPPKAKTTGGMADLRVILEVHGRKFAVAVSGDDINNSVVVAFESYILKAIIDTEVWIRLFNI